MEEITSVIYKPFQKAEEVATLTDSFYNSSINPKLKPGKDTVIKEKFRPISLMSIATKRKNP